VRRSTWVAWSLLAVWTAVVAALVVLSTVNGTFRPDAFTDSVPLLLAFASFVVVGALIVRHRPGNAVGWMFAAIALLAVLGPWPRSTPSSPPPATCPARSWPPGSPPGPGTRPSP
jgi:hypothetical protein